MLLESSLQDLSGRQVLEVVDNRVRVKRDDEVTFERRIGRVRITLPATDRYIYSEMISQMRYQDPSYAQDGRIIAADLEVVRPGLVRVLGAWPAPEAGVIITSDRLSLLLPGNREPISLIGEGEASTLVFDGAVEAKLFNFGQPKKAGAMFTVETVLHNRPKMQWVKYVWCRGKGVIGHQRAVGRISFVRHLGWIGGLKRTRSTTARREDTAVVAGGIL